jgi:hypothetical protein
MQNRFATLAVTFMSGAVLAACAVFDNPDSGEPAKEIASDRATADVIACMKGAAEKHGTPYEITSIPQGEMLDFGDSNIVKIRTQEDGRVSYRFYPGQRHTNTLWIEGAGRTCAGAAP